MSYAISMKMLRSYYRLALLGLLIGVLIFHHSLLHLLIRNPEKRLRILARSVSRYCRLSLKILNVKVDSDLKVEQTRDHLVLCNHMSYLDILTLSSIYPSLYVTSVEMKETPLLGQICVLCACLFTERRKSKRSAATMKKDIDDIASLLSHGFAMTIFPEGTSTNGLELLPFKTTLLQSAVSTEKKVLPICIRYIYINGIAFGPHNCDAVCWYGDRSFVSSLLEIAEQDEIRVKVMVSRSLSTLEFKHRSNVGATAREMINELYQRMASEHI